MEVELLRLCYDLWASTLEINTHLFKLSHRLIIENNKHFLVVGDSDIRNLGETLESNIAKQRNGKELNN